MKEERWRLHTVGTTTCTEKLSKIHISSYRRWHKIPIICPNSLPEITKFVGITVLGTRLQKSLCEVFFYVFKNNCV